MGLLDDYFSTPAGPAIGGLLSPRNPFGLFGAAPADDNPVNELQQKAVNEMKARNEAYNENQRQIALERMRQQVEQSRHPVVRQFQPIETPDWRQYFPEQL